jgi:Uma2 family endonuclease
MRVSISAKMAARQSDKTTLIEGVPQLVVEVLSPNDTLDEINEKIDTYLTAGVPLVWIVEPRRRTVTRCLVQ